MKTFKIVYYDPETDKYIHQNVKASSFGSDKGFMYFTSIDDKNITFLVLALNINNLISIEQVQ